MKRIFSTLLFLILAINGCGLFKSNGWQIKSPDGGIQIVVEANEGIQGQLHYRIEKQKNNAWTTVLPNSPLGLVRHDSRFDKGLVLVEKTTHVIDEPYDLVHGKRQFSENRANEMQLQFRNGDGQLVNLVFRAYADGIAFRYQFPRESDKKAKKYFLKEELTGFQMPANSMGFLMPQDEAGQWWPAYENNFRQVPAGQTSPTDTGWDFPALFKVDDGLQWLLITESDLDGSFCGTRLDKQAIDGLYTVRFPDKKEGMETGNVLPESTLPWTMPWRVIIVGDTAGDILESSLVTDVARPCSMKNTDWIKPGRVSWSWWSDSNSPQDLNSLKSFVDLAADMGWEYSLVDANWNKMPDWKIKSLVQYAKAKGIGLLFWYNSGGPNNIVTEEPRDRLTERERRREELAWLQKMGIKGIKVDFWHSDKQNVIKYYIDLLEDAADFEIMVNFHGCTIPRGWHRTYPNLLTLESVRGAESYKFSVEYPNLAPWHNTMLAFTRNVIGPMDYTPVTFSNSAYAHKTTHGHELALSVVFQSGWQHFADAVDSYQSLPDAPRQFLKDVPVTWDDVHVISGYPGKDVVLARRKGEDWYVAGINGEDEEKSINIEMGFLSEGEYEFVLIGDGRSSDDFQSEAGALTAETVHLIEMVPYGGFVMRMKKKNL